MPGRDGTGPLGAGPMTGRSLGRCAGFQPGYTNPVAGRGFGCFGFGRGGGRGHRNRYYATGMPGWMRSGWATQSNLAAPASDMERNALENQADILQRQLDVVKSRIDALKPDA